MTRIARDYKCAESLRCPESRGKMILYLERAYIIIFICTKAKYAELTLFCGAFFSCVCVCMCVSSHVQPPPHRLCQTPGG